ncbi:hypothetical protein [Actinocrispum wychmicini]|uniref:DUF8017 domain-containing protein n=1 Tax=Actinocrispum wychmicini TaxID=1213861 RepID=A0A4R2JIM0_9PSEU|nr:hypothetical protein [Actinocrispum wychmicini]TCO56828.1 hypothetical protein EV192_106303 [Actinocrispum wychmicini]
MSTPSGGYQGLGFYSDDKPPKKNTGLLMAIAVAAVVLLAMVATVLIVGVQNSTPGQAVADPGAKPRANSGSSSPSSRDPLQPKASGAPMVPGWTPIPINDGKDINTTKAYDVPPKWEPLNFPAIFGNGTEKTTVYIPALYMKGYCEGKSTTFRSMAGLMLVPNKGDAKDQATGAATKLANAVYTTDAGAKPTVDTTAPTPVKIDNGKDGLAVTAHVSGIAPGPNDKCNASTSVIMLVILPGKAPDDPSLVMTAWADQGFPEATPEGDLQKIVTSIHPAN